MEDLFKILMFFKNYIKILQVVQWWGGGWTDLQSVSDGVWGTVGGVDGWQD